MKTLVFLLEEPSAREMLQGILPRVLPPEIQLRYLVFEGKQDLEKSMVRRIRHWNTPDSYFLVMRDQDSGDCKKIKNVLTEKVRETGRTERTMVRIACRELESFYLGDLQAVERGLELAGLEKHQNSNKYRNPDDLLNPAQELSILTRNRYQKVAGSRAIAPFLNLKGGNRSGSFHVLLKAILRLAGQNTGV